MDSKQALEVYAAAYSRKEAGLGSMAAELGWRSSRSRWNTGSATAN